MLSFLVAILGVFITIFLVIGVHEFGHFLTARLCSVKVLRFSIGFGKTLWHWHDKRGTEYVLAAIPLGGYVKMLDENEGAVAPQELHLSFSRQPLYKRMAIIIAGPVTNIIFSFILYWLLFVIGFTTVKPIIGEITPHSIADKAGLQTHQEIVQVDHQDTLSWYSVVLKMLLRAGDKDEMQIDTRTPPENKIMPHSLNLSGWNLDDLKPDPLKSLGITPYEPNIPTTIAIIQPNSPAALSGLKVDDHIISVNNQAIKNWESLMEMISASPGKTLAFQVMRQDKKMTISVTVGSHRDFFFKQHGYLGISPNFTWDPELLRQNKYGPLAALPHALHEVKDFTLLNFIVFGKIFTGKISFQSLGGPITIFETAGKALNQGITPFLSFLAFLSISIGIINILPIPGLDGGHLLFQIIELILRRPLSMRMQMLFFRLGLIALFVLIMQALANDIMRL